MPDERIKNRRNNQMKNKAVCPKCSKPNQLTLSSFNGRIQIVCGACGQWWSIGEIEHTPYFFGGEKEINGPYELRKCEFPNCFGPVNYGKFCDQHQTPQTYSEGKEMNVPDERLRAAKELKARASECAENIRANCHATYDGGHREESSLEAFHHGMDTICNVLGNGQALAAFAAKERDSAMREAAGLVTEICNRKEEGAIYNQDFSEACHDKALGEYIVKKIHERLELKGER